MLTWHNGIIPESEIWVKVGGDRGADTVKVVFQICNVYSPNSVQNTCVFTIFEGRDTATNLHIALDRYKSQFEQLAQTEWRYMHCTIHKYTHTNRNVYIIRICCGYNRGKRIRLFMTGDYEFLSRMYGITGAQGTCMVRLALKTHTYVL